MPIDRERLKHNAAVRAGALLVLLLAVPCLFYPFICSRLPFALCCAGEWHFPFWRNFFAPIGAEWGVEALGNYLALLILALVIGKIAVPRRFFRPFAVGAALLLLLPFVLVRGKLDTQNYRTLATQAEVRAVMAIIPYDAFETAGRPGETPSFRHLLGCDDTGRDVAARLLAGGRVSLCVGVFATLIAVALGCTVGLYAGYCGGTFDLLTMRLLEIVMCFPSFLLLLIIMAMLGDYHFEQSVPVVILILGLSGWMTIALLVRAQVLKERQLPYIESAMITGVPRRKILFGHLLPNVAPPVLIAAVFGMAGAILAESGLSFLGFGVQAPAPSWGDLLRQAFDHPLRNWHLTLFPGLALFWAVFAFNLLGEGLRQVLAVKES